MASSSDKPLRDPLRQIRSRKHWRLWGLAAAIGALSTCGGGDGVTNPPSPPAVSSVEVDPPSSNVAVGQTLQLSATVRDADGNTLSGRTVVWSSGNTSVASVSSSGLLTGLSEGSATITAASEERSGSAQVSVSPDLEPNGDFELEGTRSFRSVSIPAGVTLIVTGDLALTSGDSIWIAGELAGDCVALDLIAGKALVVAGGTLSNACGVLPEEEEPHLRLVGEEGFSLEGATVTSSGDILISDDPLATFEEPMPILRIGEAVAQRPGESYPGPIPAAKQTQILDVCRLGAIIRVSPSQAPSGQAGSPDGGDGMDGDGVLVSCARGSLTLLDGLLIEAQDGGDGGDGTHRTTGFAEASGGRGGHGGRIEFSSGMDFQINGAIMLASGDGGNGGSSLAVSEPGEAAKDNGSALATVRYAGGGGAIVFRSLSDLGEIVGEGELLLMVGDAGTGGDADAVAADGRDATDTQPAQEGGDAVADAMAGTPAHGGNHFRYGGSFSPLPVASTVQIEVVEGGSGAEGGIARAQAGNGGAGSEAFPDGGDGGSSTAKGGDGAHAGRTNLVVGSLTPLADGGMGGFASFSRGNGGPGWSDCFETTAVGGRGGDGGNIFGADGLGGEGIMPGAPGGVFVESAGNGGVGGTVNLREQGANPEATSPPHTEVEAIPVRTSRLDFRGIRVLPPHPSATPSSRPKPNRLGGSA